MKVRELLVKLGEILPTHEVVTLTSMNTHLIVDIEHNHTFHAVGRYSKRDIEHYSECYFLQPFTHSIYDGYCGGEKKQYSVLDDFEVYRWAIINDEDNYTWTIEIETHQT